MRKAAKMELNWAKLKVLVQKGTASWKELSYYRQQEALDRMEHYPNGNLGWFLDFLKRHLDDLREGEWTDLAFDALVFPLVRPEFHTPWEFDEKGPSKEEVRQFQVKMRQYLNKVSSGDLCQIGIGGTFQPWVDQRKNSLEFFFRGNPHVSLVLTAFAILKESWSRLRRCHHCQTWFLMSGRKEYCSTQCSQQIRWQRYLANNPERRKKRS